MDDFNYEYYGNSNKLREVKPVTKTKEYTSGPIRTDNIVYRNVKIHGTAHVPAGSTVEVKALDDIFMDPNFQAHKESDFWAHIVEDEGTYQYDAIGNLILDQDAGVQIRWTPYGKVREVHARGDSIVVTFRYDLAGNRIEKKVVTRDTIENIRVIRYLRDSRANVMATYADNVANERYIYGSGRLGIYSGVKNNGYRILGGRRYELSNHLGSVQSVITDNVSLKWDSAIATSVSARDYYPFGLEMSARKMLDSTFVGLYGFNGKESDDGGEFGGQRYNYGARIYDPRIGQFLSVDPKSFNYPGWSNYAYVRDNPILRVDPSGKWDIEVHVFKDREKWGYGTAIVKDRHGKEVFRFTVRVEGTGGRDRLKTNADTPLGTYQIPNKNPWLTGGARESYGPNPRLILEGEDGEILNSGRTEIRIHGGRQEAYNEKTKKWEDIKDPQLKKTHGCIRCYESDVITLKETTDALEAADDQEFGGKLTITDDLVEIGGEYIYDEFQNLDAELDKLNSQMEVDRIIQGMIDTIVSEDQSNSGGAVSSEQPIDGERNNP